MVIQMKLIRSKILKKFRLILIEPIIVIIAIQIIIQSMISSQQLNSLDAKNTILCSITLMIIDLILKKIEQHEAQKDNTI